MPHKCSSDTNKAPITFSTQSINSSTHTCWCIRIVYTLSFI